jgi:hypothetical protein
MKILRISFDLKFLEHMPQVISKLPLVLQFLIWATEGLQKNRPLTTILFWQISATICVCLLIAFFLSSFEHETFEEVATVVYSLYVVFLSLKLKQKGLIYYHVYAKVANRIVWSFVWRKFSSVGIGEWWDEVWIKAQAWGCPFHPKKYPRGTSVKAWGCPRGTPSSSV